jgi:hypothetical protein
MKGKREWDMMFTLLGQKIGQIMLDLKLLFKNG